MAGRSPINIFTLGDTKQYLEEPTYNMYNGTTGQTTVSNMAPQTTNINTMEVLDNQLREQGLQIDKKMSQIDKQSFVDGLTTENYNKMLQYRDAGYSFEASKALLEMGQGAGGGGYRGEGFALNEPLGGADSIWNNLNPIGRVFELIDDQVQQIGDFDDGDDEAFSFWTMLKNIPGSALKTVSAIGRGITNPLDTVNMLKDLIFTSEGREVLKQRYGGWDELKNTLEKDPVGLISDILAVVEGGAGLVGGTAKVGGLGAKLAGASRLSSDLSKIGTKASKISRTAGIWSDMGLPIPYEKGLNTLTNRLGEGGKFSQGVGAFVSMTQRPLQTIWKGASENGSNKVLPGVSGAVGRVMDSMKDRLQTTATGLTPEVKERIRQNPYIKEYRDRVEQMLKDEGSPMDNQKILESSVQEVGDEFLKRLEDYENRLEENGAEYQQLRATTRPYNLSSFMAGVYDVLAKNGISLSSKGELVFSRTANPADMNPIITAWNVIKNMEPNLQNMTISQLLDFRMQLRSLIKYHSDAPSTKYSKGVIRQLVDGELNKLAHKEIPELAKVDDIYSKEINELTKLKDGIVYQVGEKKGQIKDNFYSIMSTINTQNRQKMKARLETIYPELGARMEAIRMLPTLVKAYQNSPKLVSNMLKTIGAMVGVKYTEKPIQLAISWILGIIADEFISKPLGEKWRKQAIDELMNEISPEAQQKLAEIKSKVDAGVDLSEQEKQELAMAIQEIAIKEREYLDEQHRIAFEEILESANNDQPKLPGTMDTIGPDGTVRLSAGKKVNNPENYQPKTREERVQEIQKEYEVEPQTAEEMTDWYEDFMDDIGGDINGEINPRKVSYERFSTKTLEKLMDDDMIPRTEKDKIEEILVRRGMEAEVDDRNALDHKFAYEINKLSEREKKILSMKSKKKSEKEYLKLEEEKERLKEKMGEQYNDQSKERVEEKYADLESKPIEYINEYKKSKAFKEDQAEKQVLDTLRGEWSKQPKFIREMDDNMAGKRQEIVDKELQNGYERQTTDVGDRFINKQTGDKGAIKYNKDGTIEAVFTEESFKNSGVMDILPADAVVRFAGEPDTIKVGELRGDEYQTVGRANPDQKTITAEEGLNLKSFKGDKTIGELADEYGLKKQIVEKIFTSEGEEALGRARGDLIELVKEIKEGTAPHEVFHPIFNMVDKKRRAEIIDLVRKHKGITEGEAKEWLAESFGDYFLTGKFDTKPIPKGFVNKVKWFFNKVKEFLNGTWKNRKKIQKLFDDIIDGKISVQKLEGGRWEYQIQQKSLFEADDPLNGYKSFDYAKLNDDISVLYDIANPVARDSNYTWDAFLNQLGLTYSSDLDAWRFRLNEEGIKIDNDKLVRIYNGIRKIANEPRSEFVLKKQTNNIVMNALNKIIDNMKADPLDIPMEYGEMNNALKQQDWSPLERYLEKHPENINALWKTYDPDVVEWRDNLEKKFTGGGYISLTELYEIKNMIDDYIKAHPEDTKIEGTIDDVGIKFLVDKARYREKNNGKIGTYDKRQIEKVGFETNEILGNRLTEVSKYMKSIDPDEYNSDFVPEVIRELGKTYDPDIEQWQKNLEEPLREIIDKYGARKSIAPGKQIVTDSGLNGLKAKIKELEKYSHKDIFNAFEGQEAEVFFRAVKPRIEELKAKGAEKAVTNLVAISNLEEGNLRKLVENFNGKDPMPSIAVMDVNVPHEVFGDISLVFGRDTVDPKVDERNKIYGSDAWTPTFPRIKETGGMSYDSVRKFASDTVDNMIDNGVELTPEEAGYLSQDIGNIILEYDGRSDLQKNADRLAEQVIEDLSMGGYEDFIENNEGAVTELQWKIENFLQSINNDRRQMIPAEYFPKGTLSQLSKNQITQMVNELTHLMMLDPDMQGYGRNELRDDLKEIINENHTKGADAILDGIKEYFDVDMNEISSKINEIYQGGVSKDRPLTPENVLEAMRNQRVNRENAPGSYRDMIEIEGAKLEDIEDVRRQNFAKVFHGDRTGDLGDLEKKYDRLLYTVAKDIMGYDDTEIIQSQNMLRQEIKRSYDKDAKTFKENLVEENEIWDAVPEEVLQRIIDVVEQGKKIPIRFSESKPERIVNLMEEVRYILVPEGADASQLKSIVRGTPLEDKVVEYKPDDNSAPRSRKLKELQKKYGNVFFSMGGVIMPIAMLLLMMQQEDEDQGEGQQA